MAIYFTSDFASDAERKARISALNLRSLARGLWTDETGDPETIVNRHWMQVVGKNFPGAVLYGRSARDLKPSDGYLFISHARQRELQLPGLTVVPVGAAYEPTTADSPLDQDKTVFAPSMARAFIENSAVQGRPSSKKPRLSRTELQDWIARVVAGNTARQNDNLLQSLGEQPESPAKDTAIVFVTAAYRNRPTVDTESPAFHAITHGEPIDAARVKLFEEAVSYLNSRAWPQRYLARPEGARFLPFYEAYFSNYIEGTEFEITEAEQIVFRGDDLGRPADAHDVLSTFQVLSDESQMSHRATTASGFIEQLQSRHSVMMSSRPEKNPGQFKSAINRAGMTFFVAPDQVVGTLKAGWEIGAELNDPFARAVYTMFYVSEVHPFSDGNGRSARVAMNIELHSAGMNHMIVPTVIRSEYLSGLNRATAGNGIEGLANILDVAQRWTSLSPFDDLKSGNEWVHVTNALVDSRVAETNGIRLLLLTPTEFEQRRGMTISQPPQLQANGTGFLADVLEAATPLAPSLGPATASLLGMQNPRHNAPPSGSTPFNLK